MHAVPSAEQALISHPAMPRRHSLKKNEKCAHACIEANGFALPSAAHHTRWQLMMYRILCVAMPMHHGLTTTDWHCRLLAKKRF
jgi:hypothetical protein